MSRVHINITQGENARNKITNLYSSCYGQFDSGISLKVLNLRTTYLWSHDFTTPFLPW